MDNRNILLLLIVLLISSFAVNAQDVCCEKIKGDNLFCISAPSTNCDYSRSSELNRDFESITASCSSFDDGRCRQECCVDTQGYCHESKTRIECEASGGRSFPGACNSQPQCTLGGCILGTDECNYITKARCEALAEERDIENFNFRDDIQSITDCSEVVLDVERGCCVKEDGCEMGTFADTRCEEGTFYEDTGCTESALLGLCEGCKERNECRQGTLYRSSNCGWEKRIEPGCDGVTTACGEDENGDAACVPLGCSVGREFFFREYDLYGGVSEIDVVRIDANMLGGKRNRRHGESWCMVGDKGGNLQPIVDGNVPIGAGESLGTRHYVFSCIKDKIVVEACGIFRDEVCGESIVDLGGRMGNYSEANCVDNRYEECGECGDGMWNKCEKNECWRLGEAVGSTDEDKARTSHCYFNSGGVNECWPKYPPGIANYDKRTSEGRPAEGSVCNDCGGGTWDVDRCNDNECEHLGDCGYKGAGAGRIATGCGAGAVIAEGLWLTAGSAGVHSQGGWGEVGASLGMEGGKAATEGAVAKYSKETLRASSTYALLMLLGQLGEGKDKENVEEELRSRGAESGGVQV